MKRNYAVRIIATIVALPLVLWAICSLTLQTLSLAYRPVHISFRLYSNVTPAPNLSKSYEFPELPTWVSVTILLSAVLAATHWLRSSRQ